MTATLDGTRRQTQTGRLDELEAEVAALRRELTALRDAVATELRTSRIVVADGDRDVTISPGDVTVSDRRNGCHAMVYAQEEHAFVGVSACDDPVKFDEVHHVSMVAWSQWDAEPGGPHAELIVNSFEMTAPA